MSKTTETGKQITLDVVESWLLVGFKELTKQMCTKKKTLKKTPNLSILKLEESNIWPLRVILEQCSYDST